MRKIIGLAWLSVGGAMLAPLMGGVALAEMGGFHQDHVLGTSLDMKAVGPAAAWSPAIAAAHAEVLRLDGVLSGWRADSELSVLNASARFEASPDLFAVIAQAERLRIVTRGAFSPRFGRALKFQRDGDVDARALARAIADAENGSVRLNPFGRLIEKDPSIHFDLDAIAKGHVLDRALLAARRAAPDLRGIMIDIGGDIAAWGDGPNDGAWSIGVAHPGVPADNSKPLHLAYLRNQAIATSGRGARDVLTKTGAVHHILSPETGGPANAIMQASVIAPNAKLADALATAFSVMRPDDSIALADSMLGVAAFVTEVDGAQHRNGRWRIYASGNEKACDAIPATGAQAPWPNGLALSVDFDIPRPKQSDAKRPYISIWVSDEQKNLVRTLLVLGDRARWRENNYIWWRRFERLKPEAIQAMSRPTRAPGKYNVVWDGKDDEGRIVRQGKYILNIEVSREHGSHGFQTIPLNIGDAAFDARADAAAEINATHAHFGVSK